MSSEQEQNTTTMKASSIPTKHGSQWRTAKERAEGLLAKKKQRRAAHRIALRRSHAKG